MNYCFILFKIYRDTLKRYDDKIPWHTDNLVRKLNFIRILNKNKMYLESRTNSLNRVLESVRSNIDVKAYTAFCYAKQVDNVIATLIVLLCTD